MMPTLLPGFTRAAGSDSMANLTVQKLAQMEREELIYSEQKKDLEKQRFTVDQDSYNLLLLRLVQHWDGNQSAVFWMQHGEFKGRFNATPVSALAHAALLAGMTAVVQIWITLMLLWNSEHLMNRWANFEATSGISLYEASRALGRAVSENQADLGHFDYSSSTSQAVLQACRETRQVDHLHIYVFVLLLWVAKLLPEFRNSKNLARYLWSVDARQDPNMPLLDADGCTVLRLDGWLRWLLIVIPCTRVLVAGLVTYAGIEFLMVQRQTGDVVLKALCMGFVTDIDNVFLNAFTSSGGLRQLQSVRLFCHDEKTPLWRLAPEVFSPDHWHNGVGGLCYIAFTLLFVGGFTGFNGMMGNFGDLGIVTHNMFYFCYQCKYYCDQFPDQCVAS